VNNHVFKGKIVFSPQKHDYSLGKKGLSYALGQFKFLFLGGMVVPRGKKG
jgi:hypothetical protein